MVDSGDPFTKARALNRAIAGLPPKTIIVQSDPDSFLAEPSHYRAAIRQAGMAPGLVVPHSRYLYLNADATCATLADGRLVRLATEIERDVDEIGPLGVGNVTVYSKETWEQAGGYDERFPMWGGDDAAFAIACGALVAEQRRLTGDVIHLYHERLPESSPGNRGYIAQLEILAAYRDADAVGAKAVRELVANR